MDRFAPPHRELLVFAQKYSTMAHGVPPENPQWDAGVAVSSCTSEPTSKTSNTRGSSARMLPLRSEELVFKGGNMIYCTQCGASVQEGNQFCGKCGTKAGISAVVRRVPRFWRVPAKDQATVPQRRFSQVFGLDPRIAFLTLIIDMMLNAGELLSMGMLVPVSMVAGVVLG
jgi:hypothetical protein